MRQARTGNTIKIPSGKLPKDSIPAGKPAAKRSAPVKKTGGKMHSSKAPSQRQLRVGEEIRHVLAGIFGRFELRDHDLIDVAVTVTEVRIGPDLRRATVFVTRLGRSDIDAKLPALRRAAPFLRAEVARALRLRVAPDLSFMADTSIDYAMYVDSLLRNPEVARDLDASHADDE